MADPGYRLGGKVDRLGNDHYGFAQAAARMTAGSHTSEADSAAIDERDAANLVKVRDNQYLTEAP